MSRRRLQEAPWWVLSSVSGTLFAIGWFAFQYLDDRPRHLVPAALGSVVLGAFFGLFTGRVIAGQRETARAVASDYGPPLTHAVEREASRATLRGPVPQDQVTRAAAARLARHQLQQYRRQRPVVLPMSMLMIGLGIHLAVDGEPWFALGVAFFAFFLVLTVVMPRRIRRRLALLEAPGSGT